MSIDSDNRRNIGYLLSWRDQRDVVISVDDDNFPMTPDFYRDHTIVAAEPHTREVTSAVGSWYNICDLLVCDPSVIWPRGYPYHARRSAAVSEASVEDAAIAVNAGVWIGDPDVDGITRAAMRPKATAYRGKSVVLAADARSAISSQNTAVRCAALPAILLPKAAGGNRRRYRRPLRRYLQWTIRTGVCQERWRLHPPRGRRPSGTTETNMTC